MTKNRLLSATRQASLAVLDSLNDVDAERERPSSVQRGFPRSLHFACHVRASADSARLAALCEIRLLKLPRGPIATRTSTNARLRRHSYRRGSPAP